MTEKLAVDYVNETFQNNPYELENLTDDSVVIRTLGRSILVYRNGDEFTEVELSAVCKGLVDLSKVLPTMVDPGNSGASEYLRGMANGALLAQSCFTDLEPNYIDTDGSRMLDKPKEETIETDKQESE